MMNCARLLAAALLLAALSLCSGQVVDLEAVPPLSCDCYHNSNRSTVEKRACHRNEDDELVCSSAEVSDLPYGYKFLQGYGLYKLYRPARSFDEAVQQCQLDGARLAVPVDETQLATLTTTLAAEIRHEVAFLGVVGSEDGSTWSGIDGETDLYLPWGADQPNISDGTCLLLNNDGTVSSASCSRQRAFFCEKITPDTVDDYVWVEEAARFYKYPGNHLTWDDAEAACESDGGTLAIPDTILRAEFLLGLLETDTNDIYVGFTDREEESVYVSVTGRKLTDMEFQDWLNGQANGGTGQDCLLLWADGYYVDIECDTTHRYVCEYAP